MSRRATQPPPIATPTPSKTLPGLWPSTTMVRVFGSTPAARAVARGNTNRRTRLNGDDLIVRFSGLPRCVGIEHQASEGWLQLQHAEDPCSRSLPGPPATVLIGQTPFSISFETLQVTFEFNVFRVAPLVRHWLRVEPFHENILDRVSCGE